MSNVKANSSAKVSPVGAFFKALGNDIKEIGVTFVKGDFATKI